MSDEPAYRNAGLPIARRVEDLLDRMTTAEKVAQLGCVWSTQLVADDTFSERAAAAVMPGGTGHVTRIAASTGLRPDGLAHFGNQIQHWLVEHTRLGIPAVIHEEAVAGFCARDATQFPQAIGLAATWDPTLVGEIGEVIRRQMTAVGARHTLSPVLDIARDPRWGRVEETYGEDPELAGQLGIAYVRSVQNGGSPDALDGGVVATAKHFLGYGLSEGARNHGPVQLGPRELREVFAEPFAAVIRDAKVASVMNSYSSVDGIACAGSPQILTGLLRDELGFGGTVVADYFSVDLIRTHHRIAADKGEAAMTALRAGLDMELPNLDCYGAPLLRCIDEGLIPIDVIDLSVRRVLTQKFALGLFERPYVDESAVSGAFGRPSDVALARRAAARAVVVLTNNGLLPLASTPGSIAVIGPAADDVRLTQGDYHYPAHVEIVYGEETADFLPQGGGAFAPGPYFPDTVTPLAALRARYPDAVITHAHGCDVTGSDATASDATASDATRIATAVATARAAELAIVCVGGRSGLVPSSTVGEARDASHLGLTGEQSELVRAVSETGTPMVVVVMSGRVHTLPVEAELADALVLAWPGGEQAGSGLIDVLSGDEEPCGRLPVTLPRATGQVPIHYNHRAGGARSQFWGDYTDVPASPLFPFGHGLTYTTFEHGPLSAVGTSIADVVRLSVAVTNTGPRTGTETVQLYVRDDVASVARPDRQLVGFARVTLGVGATAEVTFAVHPSKLAFFDESMAFVSEPGTFTFSVGTSAAEIVASCQVALEGTVRIHRQRDIVATGIEITAG